MSSELILETLTVFLRVSVQTPEKESHFIYLHIFPFTNYFTSSGQEGATLEFGSLELPT